MFKSDQGVNVVMNYLATLIQTLAEYEKSCELTLRGHFLNPQKDLATKLTFYGETPERDFLAKHWLYLHYLQTKPCERAMRKPQEHEETVRRALREKIMILEALHVSYDPPSEEIQKWLSQ